MINYILVVVAGLIAIGAGIYAVANRLWLHAIGTVIAVAGLAYLWSVFQSEGRLRVWPFTVLTFIGLAIVLVGTFRSGKRHQGNGVV